MEAMALSEGNEGDWIIENGPQAFSALSSDHSTNILIRDIRWSKSGFVALAYKENR